MDNRVPHHRLGHTTAVDNRVPPRTAVEPEVRLLTASPGSTQVHTRPHWATGLMSGLELHVPCERAPSRSPPAETPQPSDSTVEVSIGAGPLVSKSVCVHIYI